MAGVCGFHGWAFPSPPPSLFCIAGLTCSFRQSQISGNRHPCNELRRNGFVSSFWPVRKMWGGKQNASCGDEGFLVSLTWRLHSRRNADLRDLLWSNELQRNGFVLSFRPFLRTWGGPSDAERKRSFGWERISACGDDRINARTSAFYIELTVFLCGGTAASKAVSQGGCPGVVKVRRDCELSVTGGCSLAPFRYVLMLREAAGGVCTSKGQTGRLTPTEFDRWDLHYERNGYSKCQLHKEADLLPMTNIPGVA
jgi:hypothetical protein